MRGVVGGAGDAQTIVSRPRTFRDAASGHPRRAARPKRAVYGGRGRDAEQGDRPGLKVVAGLKVELIGLRPQGDLLCSKQDTEKRGIHQSLGQCPSAPPAGCLSSNRDHEFASDRISHHQPRMSSQVSIQHVADGAEHPAGCILRAVTRVSNIRPHPVNMPVAG